MTIRNKTLLLIVLTIGGLMAVIATVSTRILNDNLRRVEAQNTRENVSRVRDALHQVLEQMDSATVGWSQWDDSRDFVLGQRQAQYHAANLTPSTLAALKADVIVYTDRLGRIIFATSHQLKQGRNLPLSPSVRRHIQPNNPLLKHKGPKSSHLGLLMTPEGPLLIASRPIVNNEATGAIYGAIIVGRYFSAAQIAQIARTTHLPLDIRRLDAALPKDFQAAREQLPFSPSEAGSPSVLVRPISAGIVAGYTVLDDVYGKPALLARVDVRRDIFQQGQLALRNLLGSLLLAGICFGGVMLLMLERVVLSRLSRLSREVGGISHSGDISRRVPQAGGDELSRLGCDINQMLATLEAAREERERSRAKIEESLCEKESLLKEVYHRVKNNLQVISSMLSLQAQALSDPVAQAALRQSQSRVYSISLVHERLYRASDLTRIELRSYLNELCADLWESYEDEDTPVELKLDVPPLSLDMDAAIPCGLIVNELVSNAFKHAFRLGRRGTLAIQVLAGDKGQLLLRISDDGPGFPSGVDFRNLDSLGLQLVIALAQQNGGEVELDSAAGQGTRWTVSLRPTQLIWEPSFSDVREFEEFEEARIQ